jgi:SAM-dependent methyltransferase
MTAAKYDTIGVGYAAHRRADPRVAAQVRAALGPGRVVNVGAGAGSYEPPGTVVAVEPSAVMLGQRPPGSAPAVRAIAEALPLPDGCGDAGLASLTIHHWTDPGRGLDELIRVAPARTIVLSWDKPRTWATWLFADYFPEIVEMEAGLPGAADITALLEARGRRVEWQVVPVPADCTDGFAIAYWARPEAYLEPGVWQAMSGIALLEPAVRDDALGRLQADLADGSWHRRHGHLLELTDYDAGYRLLAATPR